MPYDCIKTIQNVMWVRWDGAHTKADVVKWNERKDTSTYLPIASMEALVEVMISETGYFADPVERTG
jgi:hypothetical protein